MEPVSVSLVTKIIGWAYSLKDWFINLFWIFRNATKIRNNFDKVTAEKPCPICKTEMSYSKKAQAVQHKVKLGKMVDIPVEGKYWFYYKCTKSSCPFKDDVPFHYQSW